MVSGQMHGYLLPTSKDPLSGRTRGQRSALVIVLWNGELGICGDYTSRFSSLDKTGVTRQDNKKDVPTIAKRFTCSNVKSVFRLDRNKQEDVQY